MFINDPESKNAMLAAIIDSSEDAIISKSLDGNITSWNKAAERMFGYMEAEILGKNIAILIPDDRLSEEAMIIGKLKKGEKIEHFETIRRKKSGEEIFISLSVSPIKTGDTIVGASKIVRDITEQKRIQLKLRENAENLELIDFIGKKIFSKLDAADIIQSVTDATTRISGAAFGAFFYNKVDENGEAYILYGLSGAPREAFEKFGMPRNTDVFKITFEGEGILRSDDITADPRYGKNKPHAGMPAGHLPVVSYLAVPVVGKSGVVIGGLFFGHPKRAMFKDEHEKLVSAIATQASIALENAKLYEELKTLSSKKDEFIGFASHELRTPITTMSGYLQLAEKSPELLASFLPKIDKQVHRLSAIVSDLLDISKIEAGRLDLNREKCSLNAIVKDSIEAVKKVNEDREILYSEPLHDETVFVDCPKITQVITNLLTNAIKYSAADQPVRITSQRLGDEIQIDVEDKGIGISQEHLEKIFTRFYRIANDTTVAQGLGIGLYLSREIMEIHRGKIWIESEEGKGSTFHISFPIDSIR